MAQSPRSGRKGPSCRQTRERCTRRRLRRAEVPWATHPPAPVCGVASHMHMTARSCAYNALESPRPRPRGTPTPTRWHSTSPPRTWPRASASGCKSSLERFEATTLRQEPRCVRSDAMSSSSLAILSLMSGIVICTRRIS